MPTRSNDPNVRVETFSYVYDELGSPVTRNADSFAYNARGEVTNAAIAAATSMVGVSNIWVSAGAVPGVYRVEASYPNATNATAFVIDPVIDINGDFFRTGAIADDPREANPVCFTNAFGIVIPCNNNDSDGDGIPDCADRIVNGTGDATDLGRIVVAGMGLEVDKQATAYVQDVLNRSHLHNGTGSVQRLPPRLSMITGAVSKGDNGKEMQRPAFLQNALLRRRRVGESCGGYANPIRKRIASIGIQHTPHHSDNGRTHFS